MSIVDTIKELVSIPSTQDGTDRIEELVASKVGQVAEAELIRVGDMGRNVLARVVHDEILPTIVLNGHLDTVNVCDGWTREPFEPVLEGDRLYGLGSVDMKSGVAMAMEMFGMLAGLGTVNVTFVGTIDEEGDSAGAFALLDRGIEGDICLIPEPSNETVMMGCRGRLVFDVLVHGRSAHGARPDEGVNAVEEASRFVAALGNLGSLEHEILGTGSICVLEMSGGTGTLSVPERCNVRIDRHYVPGETEDGIREEMESVAASLGSEAIFDIGPSKRRKTPFMEPYITPETDLVKLFLRSVNGKTSYGRSVGDYNAFAGIMPTLVYGPDGGNWHAADEWVSVSSVDRCLDGYKRFANALKETKT